MRVPTHRRLVAALATIGACLALTAPAGAVGDPDAPIGARLADALTLASPADVFTVVAALGAPADDGLLAAFDAIGVDAIAFEHLPSVGLQVTAPQLALVRAVPEVQKVWLNTELDLALAQTRAILQADTVHEDLGFTGAGVGIAILDSGIDATHQDLAFGSKTVQNVKIVGNQHLFSEPTIAIEDVPNTDTTVGHGTHVAGIAGGSGAANADYAGIAKGADLIGVGAADGVEMLTALAGYDWILDHHDTYGIRVINNSWADGAIEYDPQHPLNVASRAAYDAGIVVVFAAGNDGQANGDVFNRYAIPDWVVSVGGATKLGTLADYSSRGTDVHHADLMAPGSFVASTMASTGVVGVPNQSPFDFTDPLAPRVVPTENLAHYTVKIGTSMAAPHVAGTVALMLEANPDLGPDEVRDLLIASATPMPGCPVRDCGAGHVNALAAVEAARAAVNEAPRAVVAASSATGAAPLTVTLDASASHDPDGTVIAWAWDLDGDGAAETSSDGPSQTVTLGAGRHVIGLVVTDDDGRDSLPVTVEVRASAPPVADADAPRKVRAGEAFTVDASASHDPDGEIVAWTFELSDGTTVTQTSPVLTHVFGEGTNRKGGVRVAWRVVVTDDAGLQDAVSGTVRVKRAHS